MASISELKKLQAQNAQEKGDGQIPPAINPNIFDKVEGVSTHVNTGKVTKRSQYTRSATIWFTDEQMNDKIVPFIRKKRYEKQEYFNRAVMYCIEKGIEFEEDAGYEDFNDR